MVANRSVSSAASASLIVRSRVAASIRSTERIPPNSLHNGAPTLRYDGDQNLCVHHVVLVEQRASGQTFAVASKWVLEFANCLPLNSEG